MKRVLINEELDQIGKHIIIGADVVTFTARTNATNKLGALVSPHYINAEEDMWLIGGVTTTDNNQVTIGGGGSPSYNTATNIYFMSATDTTTTTPTVVAGINIDGLHVDTINEYNAAGVTINNEVYLPEITGSGTGTSMIYYNRSTGELSYADQPAGTSDVSVTNQGDNRVITSTATTDVLNAEANMTFDVSTLTLPNAS